MQKSPPSYLELPFGALEARRRRQKDTLPPGTFKEAQSAGSKVHGPRRNLTHLNVLRARFAARGGAKSVPTWWQKGTRRPGTFKDTQSAGFKTASRRLKKQFDTLEFTRGLLRSTRWCHKGTKRAPVNPALSRMSKVPGPGWHPRRRVCHQGS